MKTTAERLQAIISHLGITKNKFAENIGTSSALISKLTTQNVDFRVDILQKIVSKYPEINLRWLLTGNGEMIEEKEFLDGKLTERLLDNATNYPLQEDFKTYFKGVINKSEVYEFKMEAYTQRNRLAHEILIENKEYFYLFNLLQEFERMVFTLQWVDEKYMILDRPEDFYRKYAGEPGEFPSYESYKKSIIERIELLIPYVNQIKGLNANIRTFIKTVSTIDPEKIKVPTF